VGPFSLCTPEEMAVIRRRIDTEVLTRDGPAPKRIHARHLDSRLVYDLCAHPAIVTRMASLYGPDLILWSSHFWIKEARIGEALYWHQDTHYWPMRPPITLSAWLAIDEVTRENGCVQLIPGSHKTALPHATTRLDDGTRQDVDPKYIDAERIVSMPLRPGEFFLFHGAILHYSPANASDTRRFGMAIRVTVPRVNFHKEKLFDGFKVIVLRGEDRLGLNEVAAPLQ
jgi:ectoine hydroxylase-related dioxygenase (phytanoyl-CoA dioxygenase family)